MALVDTADKSIVASYEYDPFGNTLRATGARAGENPFRFSTKYTDQETGLVYYGYRYYGPEMGRWLSRDPIGEPENVTLYVSLNNRGGIESVDYLGLSEIVNDGWGMKNKKIGMCTVRQVKRVQSGGSGLDVVELKHPVLRTTHKGCGRGCLCFEYTPPRCVFDIYINAEHADDRMPTPLHPQPGLPLTYIDHEERHVLYHANALAAADAVGRPLGQSRVCLKESCAGAVRDAFSDYVDYLRTWNNHASKTLDEYTYGGAQWGLIDVEGELARNSRELLASIANMFRSCAPEPLRSRMATLLP